jgi:hypothetical protein
MQESFDSAIFYELLVEAFFSPEKKNNQNKKRYHLYITCTCFILTVTYHQIPSCITCYMSTTLLLLALQQNKLQKITCYTLAAFLAANNCRIKESFLPPARADVADMTVLVLLGTSTTSVSEHIGGGGSVCRKESSILTIWLKHGLVFGSSTQHDCTMKTNSGGVPSGSCGLIC